ncbi:endolytic transglycosylase MltG [Patescibacteria group bacterium]|nr:endolytic transglycosylase MltG [Patescibacteria group bacterium]
MKKNIKKILKLLKNKIFLIVLGIVLIIVILLIFSFPVGGSQEKLIIIEKGWGTNEMGQKLKEQEMIKNKWFFVFYVWFRGFNDSLKAGEYLLNSDMSVLKISEIIFKGDIAPNWVKATIPEGWTNKNIEKRLVELGVFTEKQKLPLEQEGYLFPDTYYFYRKSSVKDVVNKMNDNFNKKVDQDLLLEIEKQGKTLHDVLTMASIIEREVFGYEDRRIVSGIFWDRLKINYPLQSCATLAYIIGKDKKRYSYEDTRIESPYNTYLNPGLPPGPINNPSLPAIQAAIYPKFTDYFFFLSASDGTTIFSATVEEHNANKDKYLD